MDKETEPQKSETINEIERNHDHWVLAKPRPGLRRADVTIKWSINLANGTDLADEANKLLLRSCQEYIEAILSDPLPGSLPVVASTALNRWQLLRVLIKWMFCNGITCFSGLDAETVREFLESVGTGSDPRTGRQHTRKRVESYALLCRDLYHYRGRLSDSIQENPFPHGSPRESVKHLGVDLGKWKSVPDSLAVKYVSGALRLIEKPADDILRIRNAYGRAFETSRLSGSQRYVQARNAIAEEQFSLIPGEQTPWCTRPVTDINNLAVLAQRIRDSCLVVILFVAGTRISEALQFGPGCLTKRKHFGGETHAYLVGKLAKSGGRIHEWIAADAVLRAIDVVKRLSAPYRKRSGVRNYWISTPGSSFWPGYRTGRRIGTICRLSVSRRMNALAKFLDADKHDGKPWRYATHQGRKTFARFVTKRDKRALYALSQHYGHLHYLITDKHYAGTDYSLTEMIHEESQRDLRASLEDLLGAQKRAGKGSALIDTKVRSLKFRGKSALRAEVEKLIQGGVALAPCNWGYCIYRPETSACKGDSIGPNPRSRTPSLCSDCANFVATDMHREWWENRKKECVAILNQPGVREQTRAVLKARIEECDRILSRLRAKKEDQNR